MKETKLVVTPCSHNIPDPGTNGIACFCGRRFVRNGFQLLPFTGAELIRVSFEKTL